ncbi:PREDICTED: uncharacterized protein LOC109243003 [Nicotiana attenuata]|uniref:uncharacterized protein LOC109243003 n=1 Tax=Nicotiana attenuata TaxID=49451 RepID=UPI000905B1D3|nr:PREDICTED: uncharacterized protein LOC109243003 [Nicotiana attenuata]
MVGQITVVCLHHILQKGQEDTVTDDFSRREDSIQLYSISGYQSGSPVKAHYKWQNGILSRKGKIMVGADEKLRKKLRCKHENVAYPGLLQPLPIPSMVLQDISMDFIEGLPKARGKDVIYVVVDRLSKDAHFIPLRHLYSALEVAQAFMDNIFKLHGMPKSIMADMDVLEAVDRGLQAREATLRAVKAHLLKAQDRMKAHVDKGRTDRTYAVGDLITHKVGVVAYALALPTHSKIHPTFHISQLKKKIGNHLISPVLPTVHTEHGYVLMASEAILDRRLAQKHGRATTQTLVKWLNTGLEDNTWEDLHDFQLRFPHFNP